MLLKDEVVKEGIVHRLEDGTIDGVGTENRTAVDKGSGYLLSTKAPAAKDIIQSAHKLLSFGDKDVGDGAESVNRGGTSVDATKADVANQLSTTGGAETRPDAILDGEGNAEPDLFQVMINLEEVDEADQDEDRVYSFEVASEKVETIRRRCNQIDHPMIEEYDFRHDTSLSNLDIDLRPTTVIRPYQEKSLSKMFGNGWVAVLLWIHAGVWCWWL